MTNLSASILSSKNMLRDLEMCEMLGVDILHIDWFVQEDISEKIEKIRANSNIPTDFHVIGWKEGLLNEIVSFDPKCCCFQYNKKDIDSYDFAIKHLRANFISPGIAFCLGDNFEEHEDLIKQVDFVMIMNTVPGVSGVSLDLDKSLEYIRRIRNKYPGLKLRVDGGINAGNIKSFSAYNIDSFVCGSFLLDKKIIGYFGIRNKSLILDKKVTEYAIYNKDLIIDKPETLQQVVKAIDIGKRGFAVVTEDNNFEGIVADGDIRRSISKGSFNLKDMLNVAPVICNSEDTVGDLFRKIEDSNLAIKYIPIVNNKKFLGYVSVTRILGQL